MRFHNVVGLYMISPQGTISASVAATSSSYKVIEAQIRTPYLVLIKSWAFELSH